MNARLRAIDGDIYDFVDGQKNIQIPEGTIHANVKYEIHERDYGILIYTLECLDAGETRVLVRTYVPWHRIDTFTVYGED